jgi:hypothetical protein
MLFYWSINGPGGKVIQELQNLLEQQFINEDQLLKKELLKF